VSGAPHYSDDELIPISALQHFLFCPRQCALIHLERIWEENSLTAEGRRLHERAHDGRRESRRQLRIARGLTLRSERHGLVGRADIVEFHRTEADGDCRVRLRGAAGWWQPFPVEYKRGRPKRGNCDKVQLCAQALCLEEMLETSISRGALFYGGTHRRLEVQFDSRLRADTAGAALTLHELLRREALPPPTPGPKCGSCSIEDRCLPSVAGGERSAKAYVSDFLHGSSEAETMEES